MDVVEGKLYRIVFNKERGGIEIIFEPWELLSSTTGESYYERVIEELKELEFREEIKEKVVILKASIVNNFDEILDKVEEVLESYGTTILLKKTAC